jgi:hypothetical protein
MIRFILPSVFVTAALATVLPTTPAHATLLTRTFVSSAGMDTNPCTITQPCATFARAYSLTMANGIIAALAPGKYGPLIITGPITINGYGWASITGPASGIAINISAGPNDAIKLSGLEIDGANVGVDGIAFGTGRSLIVSNCVIRQFAFGMVLNAAQSNTELSDSVFENNMSDGVLDAPLGAGATFTFDHVRFFGNATAMSVQDGNAPDIPIKASGSDSIAAGNGVGFDAAGNGIILFLDNVRAVNNTKGVWVQKGLIFLSRSALDGNGTGYQIDSGATLEITDNNLFGDEVSLGTPTFQ